MKRSWDLTEAGRPVRAARQYVAETTDEWGLAHYRDDATLLVSEMVTNACRYGLPPITLALSCAVGSSPRPPELVIEVSDALSTPPTRRTPSDHGGLGMVVIERLAALTVITHDAGKTVRAVLTTTDQPELEQRSNRMLFHEGPEVMSTSDVAAVFGVDPKTVTRWANIGKLHCPLRTLGGHRRFFKADIQALIAEQNRRATEHDQAEPS